jgi:hypothetical protein
MIPSYILFPLAIVAGGLGRRIVGGLGSQWLGVDLGDTPVRAFWAALLAGVSVLAGAPLLFACAVLIGIFAGSTVGMWGGFSIGHSPGRNTGTDILLMTAHGLAGTIVVACAAYWFGLSWWPLVAAGALCAPCYALAWWQPVEIPLLGCYRGDTIAGSDPPPEAELTWGALVGVAIALAA